MREKMTATAVEAAAVYYLISIVHSKCRIVDRVFGQV